MQHEFYIHGSVHRESNLITAQQDVIYSVYYISAGSSTCFGCWHPSSGARTTVITASDTGQPDLLQSAFVVELELIKLNKSHFVGQLLNWIKNNFHSALLLSLKFSYGTDRTYTLPEGGAVTALLQSELKSVPKLTNTYSISLVPQTRKSKRERSLESKMNLLLMVNN